MLVERLKAENYDELMDFINMVFSQDLIRVHFAEDLPLIFGRDDEHMSWQYALRDDSGRIRCAVASIPYTYVVEGKEFKARTITNVATHYQHTGKGYMQRVLGTALEDMRADGVDFAILSGHRERYRFWGFEAAGTCISADYAAYNIQNRVKRGEVPDFTFELVGEGDTEMIARCLELFNREPQHYLRTADDFILFNGMWRGRVYAVRSADGEFCGYLNYCDRWGRAIREIMLTDNSLTTRVVDSFIRFAGIDNVQLTISPFDEEQVRRVYADSEGIVTTQMCRMNLLRPEGLLEACLNAKLHGGAYMPEGELVIESIFGRLLIRNDGGFTVEKTAREPDVTVPGYEIYSVLFGPSSQVIQPFSAQLGKFGAWFPAPIYIHNTDRY